MTELRSLYGWFAASALQHGGRPALEIAGRFWTYGRLSELADLTASALMRANGGQRPARVGLLASRSLGAYAGYIAVQRLGATVVPLSLSLPRARLLAVRDAAHLDILLADAEDLDLGLPSLSISDVESLCGGASYLPAHGPGGRDIAYILFTSGSTGVPKGVPVSHGNVDAYLRHVVQRYDPGPGARVSQAFDLAFDVSVFDMFVAWGSGATLVVPTRDEVLAPVRFVSERAITHWCSVPSVISVARRLRALRPGAMPGLRASLFAGEPLTLQQAEAWQAAAPNGYIENFYGPTETTITCSEYRLPADRTAWPRTPNGTVPIGQVYPRLDRRIIGPDGEVGAQGELCIRGDQRFAGYLNPSDNRDRFFSFEGGRATPYDGVGPLTDEHWYRTGDSVTAVGDALLHLGRLDQQIKLNGYRIELGEIESALRGQDGVHDAVVVPIAGKMGEVDLKAMCTGPRVSPERLKIALLERLPAYMVPRAIIGVPELPLNANGKIDRRVIVDMMTREGNGEPV